MKEWGMTFKFHVMSCSFFLIGFLNNTWATCVTKSTQKFSWTRKIDESTLPPGVRVVDRVWIENPTSKELVIFIPEKGAELRTHYREKIHSVPTTKDELPRSRLIDGVRYVYHYPSNPDFSSGVVVEGGWVRQDYPAELIEPRLPVLKPEIESKLFNEKIVSVSVKVPVPIYFDRMRKSIDFIFEFSKNKKFGISELGCP